MSTFHYLVLLISWIEEIESVSVFVLKFYHKKQQFFLTIIVYDQVGPEVEISLDDDDRHETGSNSDQRPQEDVLESEDEEAVLHLQEEEEEMPIHHQVSKTFC